MSFEGQLLLENPASARKRFWLFQELIHPLNDDGDVDEVN
jgi:hypothetical protein